VAPATPDGNLAHMPNAIIVGAGIAGLSAAEVLQRAGWQIEIIDKGQTPGGRFASRWFGDRSRRIDVGAQFLSVRDGTFAAAIDYWEERGWVRRWCTGIPVLDAQGLHDGEDGFPRWLGVGGMHALGRALAARHVLRQPATVTRLHQAIGHWQVEVVPGDAIRGTASGPPVLLDADAVVLTQPTPQIATLLGSSGIALPDGLGAVRYDPCVAVVIDVPNASTALLKHPGAVRIEDPASPLSWIASANGRGEIVQGDLLLLHARGEWSAAHQDHSTSTLAEELLAAARPTLTRLGITRDLTHCHAEARLWRYSRCIAPCAAPFLSTAGTPPLAIAGDGFGNCPRVEGAWLSGRAAGTMIRDAVGRGDD
jgi:predicted NAD/FAD-dependent oxidoreductase